jgi:hypothetical protein
MSPERHLFVSPRHRAGFRATVIFSDYRIQWTWKISSFAQF